ncbi:muscleblind-like protein 2 isoform X1 [Limulus polyphemus]|uniref:Muscleblind-like protein 2 isoform X1 n=1 Tax=Limulus polyphemus TaxID=6850 RepID=A0ABM1B561_LIMPO|nr:muscleblind-like protein 2 isoform X1 [Limulus polyphemus]
MIMAMVNNLPTAKDSRWLQLEVCREYQRNKCSRADTECKFAHPPGNVEVQNGRVITCYDSIKGRCNREKPPCKYFHPPQHLKDQLLINGRNHLALKNALLQQMPLQPILPSQIPAVAATNSYMATLPTMATGSTFSPYLNPSPIMGMMSADAIAAPLSIIPAPMVTPQKMPRTDRLEVCREYQRGNCKRTETECRFAHPPEHVAVDGTEGMVTVCMDFIKGRCTRDPCRYFHPPLHLQAQLKASQSRANTAAMVFPGMVPYTKRTAFDKSGLPMYQPSTTPYQQAITMQVQQPFVPVSFAVHPGNVPRF